MIPRGPSGRPGCFLAERCCGRPLRGKCTCPSLWQRTQGPSLTCLVSLQLEGRQRGPDPVRNLSPCLLRRRSKFLCFFLLLISRVWSYFTFRSCCPQMPEHCGDPALCGPPGWSCWAASALGHLPRESRSQRWLRPLRVPVPTAGAFWFVPFTCALRRMGFSTSACLSCAAGPSPARWSAGGVCSVCALVCSPLS